MPFKRLRDLVLKELLAFPLATLSNLRIGVAPVEGSVEFINPFLFPLVSNSVRSLRGNEHNLTLTSGHWKHVTSATED
jgi:hypothetical protein